MSDCNGEPIRCGCPPGTVLVTPPAGGVCVVEQTKPVPTLNEWGLTGLLVGVAILALYNLRGRS
jgi:hypothetical protein